MNKKFLKSNIDDISIKLLEEVIEHAYTAGHSSFAPLGCSGDDFILFGLPRRKEITIKLHSGTVKLLVTDNCGQFLFHGGFCNALLPTSFIAQQYFAVIQNVKHLIDNEERDNSSISEADKEKMYESAMLLHANGLKLYKGARPILITKQPEQ
jgi:hypothetical protein